MSRKDKKEKNPAAGFSGSERVIAIIASVLIPLPLMITSVVCNNGAWEWQGALTMSGCGAAAWLLGLLLGFLLIRAGRIGIYFVRIGFILGGIGLVAAYEILFYQVNYGSIAIFLMPVAICLWYRLGYRAGAGQDPVPYVVLGGYCAEAAFMFPLCGSFEKELHEGRNLILLVTAAVTVLGALIINSRHLNRISLRGKSDSTILSVASKRFNVKTTLIFSGILLLLFFFAGGGAKLLWESSKAILRFFLYLISLIPKSENDYELEYGGGEIPQAEAGSEGSNLIGQIIMAVILSVLFILLLKPMIKGLRKLYRKIMRKLGRTVETEQIPQYTDIYQVSDREEPEKSSFKKAVRAFRKEKDNTKKYRSGYKAFMIYIGEKSEQPTSAETTRVHLEKGRELTDSPYLEQAVETYCKVRYDDYVAEDSDIIIMKNLLKSLK